MIFVEGSTSSRLNFTEQQLKKERAAANHDLAKSTNALQHYQNHAIERMHAIRALSLRADGFLTLFGHAQSGREKAEAHATTLRKHAIALESHLAQVQAHSDSLGNDAEDLRMQLLDTQDTLEETRAALEQAQQNLDHTQESLEDVTTQRRELNLDLYDTKMSLDEGQRVITDLEDQLTRAREELEEVVSERNSLHVHARNLEQELAGAKDEIAETEKRYSTLQAQQLANLSAEAIPKRLKEQLTEIEERLARRTKEKENLIHDVKRLETNLRLQEERLTEMTDDLERVEMENSAMVEDCATTRASRDDAMRRVEDLEIDIDALEVQLHDAEARSARAQKLADENAKKLIIVLAETVVSSNLVRRRRQANVADRQALLSNQSLRLATLEGEKKDLLDTMSRMEHQQSDVLHRSARSESTVSHLADLVAQHEDGMKNMVIALAVCHQHQRRQLSFVQDFKNARSVMRSCIETLQHGLEDHRARVVVLNQDLSDSRSSEKALVEDLEQLRRQLEAIVDSHERALREAESVSQQAMQDLAAREGDLETLRGQLSALSKENVGLRESIDNSTSSRTVETQALRDELSQLKSEFDGVLEDRKALGDQLQASVAHLADAKQHLDDRTRELEDARAQLHQARENLQALESSTSESNATRDRMNIEIEQLRSTLAAVQADVVQKFVHAAFSRITCSNNFGRDHAVATAQNQVAEVQAALELAQRSEHAAKAAIAQSDDRIAQLQQEITSNSEQSQHLATLQDQYNEQLARADQMLRDIEANDDHLIAYVIVTRNKCNDLTWLFLG
jgi:chromosome segregation ATPase